MLHMDGGNTHHIETFLRARWRTSCICDCDVCGGCKLQTGLLLLSGSNCQITETEETGVDTVRCVRYNT